MISRAVRFVVQAVVDLVDPRPSVSVAHVQQACIRAEMDRHPLDREELWPGLAEPHVPVGTKIRPGDVATSPVFGKTT